MVIRPEAYPSAGYFVVRASATGFRLSPLMPVRVVSLSRCICARLEITWGWDLARNQAAALDFGLRIDRLEAFRKWSLSASADSESLPDVATAREAIREFLTPADDLLLLGVGWTRTGVAGDRPALEAGSEPLGYEVVSYRQGLGCSWLCSGLESEMHALYGIHPNDYGLMETLDEAQRVWEWIAADEMRGRRAEPEPYEIWLITRYPNE